MQLISVTCVQKEKATNYAATVIVEISFSFTLTRCQQLFRNQHVVFTATFPVNENG